MIITKIMKDYEDKNKRFSGIAFVSFDTEDMKNLVLQHNVHSSFERFCSFLNSGKTPNIDAESDLSWEG